MWISGHGMWKTDLKMETDVENERENGGFW